MNSVAISLTNLWKGSFLMSRSVVFWYLRISLRAIVPGLYLCFLTPPFSGAVATDFLAAFAAKCFLGAFWLVDFLAVYFVRAIFPYWKVVFFSSDFFKKFLLFLVGIFFCILIIIDNIQIDDYLYIKYMSSDWTILF